MRAAGTRPESLVLSTHLIPSRLAFVSRSRRHVVLGVLVTLLLIGHVVQPAPGIEPVLLGWLPWDLAYHLLWMAAAAGAVLFMTDVVWRFEEDRRLRDEEQQS